MDVVMVSHPPDHLGLRIGLIHPPSNRLGAGYCRAAHHQSHLSPADLGFTAQTQVARAAAVRVVIPDLPPKSRRPFGPYLRCNGWEVLSKQTTGQAGSYPAWYR